ncbi:hypothetical protein LY78DRAFT_687661 [Colletotrichum sublineola]|nr:hypothetical protein LY78DRAFT_687661 [Colletotrichum sublineola]
MSLRVRKELVRDAANLILREAHDNTSGTPAPTVGINWVARFVKRHGYLCIKDKVLDASRKAAENAESFQGYFNKLQQALKTTSRYTQGGIGKEYTDYS